MPRPSLEVGERGSISAARRPDGNWVARGHIRDLDGVRRQAERTGTTRREALQRLNDHLDERTTRRTDPDEAVGIVSTTPLRKVIDEWLEDMAADEHSPSTTYTYGRAAAQLAKALGTRPVGDITVAVCRNYLRKLSEDHPTKARLQRTVLGQVMDVAVSHQAISHNPVRSVRGIHKPEKKANVALTEDDLRTLRSQVLAWQHEITDARRHGPAPEWLLPDLVCICLGTGCRIGEALALRWEDVDFEVCTVTIAGTVIPTKGKAAYRKPTPKSTSGYRTLVVPQFVIDMLLRRRDEQPDNRIDAVFPSRNGTWRSTHNTHRLWRQFRKANGIPTEVTFRAFRKAVATILDRELSASVAQKQLGHSREATTLAHYIAKPAIAPDSSALLQKHLGGTRADDY